MEVITALANRCRQFSNSVIRFTTSGADICAFTYVSSATSPSIFSMCSVIVVFAVVLWMDDLRNHPRQWIGVRHAQIIPQANPSPEWRCGAGGSPRALVGGVGPSVRFITKNRSLESIRPTQCEDKRNGRQQEAATSTGVSRFVISLRTIPDSRHTATFRSASSPMYQ